MPDIHAMNHGPRSKIVVVHWPMYIVHCNALVHWCKSDEKFCELATTRQAIVKMRMCCCWWWLLRFGHHNLLNKSNTRFRFIRYNHRLTFQNTQLFRQVSSSFHIFFNVSPFDSFFAALFYGHLFTLGRVGKWVAQHSWPCTSVPLSFAVALCVYFENKNKNRNVENSVHDLKVSS